MVNAWPNMTRIKYFVRHVYGTPMRYVWGRYAEPLQQLTGRITLSNRDMDALAALGVEFEYIADPGTV